MHLHFVGSSLRPSRRRLGPSTVLQLNTRPFAISKVLSSATWPYQKNKILLCASKICRSCEASLISSFVCERGGYATRTHTASIALQQGGLAQWTNNNHAETRTNPIGSNLRQHGRRGMQKFWHSPISCRPYCYRTCRRCYCPWNRNLISRQVKRPEDMALLPDDPAWKERACCFISSTKPWRFLIQTTRAERNHDPAPGDSHCQAEVWASCICVPLLLDEQAEEQQRSFSFFIAGGVV